MTLRLLLSFGGEMDVLHSAVSGGWLNVAADADLASGWGLWVLLWFLSTSSFLCCDTHTWVNRNPFCAVKWVVLLSQCPATACDYNYSHMHEYCKMFVCRFVIADACLGFFTVLSLIYFWCRIIEEKQCCYFVVKLWKTSERVVHFYSVCCVAALAMPWSLPSVNCRTFVKGNTNKNFAFCS